MTEDINNDKKFGHLENYDNELTNTALKENNQNKLKEHYENITQALNNIWKCMKQKQLSTAKCLTMPVPMINPQKIII